MKRPNFDNQEETIKWLDANYPIGTIVKSALSDRIATRVDEISYTRKGCYATKVNSTEKVFLIYNYGLTPTPPLCDLPTSSNADDYFIPGRIYKHKTRIDIFGIYRGETKDNRSFFETLSSNKEVGVNFNSISKHSFEPIFKDKCWCYSGLKDSFDSRKDYSIKNVEEELKITFNNIPLPNQKMDIKKDNYKPIFKIGDFVKLIANTNRSHNKIGDIGTIQEITKINNDFYTYKVKVQDNDSQLTWSIASDLELIKSLIPPKPLIANYPYADVSSKTLDSIQSIGRQERKPTLRKIQEIPQLKNKFHKTKS